MMKKSIVFSSAVLSAALLLSACGGTASSSVAPATSAPPAVESTSLPALEGTPVIEMMKQVYEPDPEAAGMDIIIEVPNLSSFSPSTGEINTAILAFAGDYEEPSSEGMPEVLQLKTYPFTSDEYLQIVMTRMTLPNYATYGDVTSFIYDVQNDAVLGPLEVMAEAGLDKETLQTKLGESSIMQWNGGELTDISIDGARICDDGVELYIKYFYSNPEATDGDGIVTYDSATDTFYNYSGELLIDPREPDSMDPPLWYEQQGLPDISGSWVLAATDVPLSSLTIEGSSVSYSDAASGQEYTGSYTQYANTVLFDFGDDLAGTYGTATGDFLYLVDAEGVTQAFVRDVASGTSESASTLPASVASSSAAG